MSENVTGNVVNVPSVVLHLFIPKIANVIVMILRLLPTSMEQDAAMVTAISELLASKVTADNLGKYSESLEVARVVCREISGTVSTSNVVQ